MCTPKIFTFPSSEYLEHWSGDNHKENHSHSSQSPATSASSLLCPWYQQRWTQEYSHVSSTQSANISVLILVKIILAFILEKIISNHEYVCIDRNMTAATGRYLQIWKCDHTECLIVDHHSWNTRNLKTNNSSSALQILRLCKHKWMILRNVSLFN